MAHKLVEFALILLENLFDSCKLIAIGSLLFRKLLNIGNITSLPFFWVVFKVEWTIFLHFVVGFHLFFMLLFLIFVGLFHLRGGLPGLFL
jgi:hypothetical protein